MSKATVEKMQLNDGREVELKINFAALYKLRSVNKPLYEKYNKILMKGTEDVLEMLPVIYTGYVCANLDEPENLMTEQEFTELIPFDLKKIASLCKVLMGTGKK